MKSNTKKMSLCLAAVAVVAMFVACGGSHSDDASTPGNSPMGDVSNSVPFEGQFATEQQIANLKRTCNSYGNGSPSTHLRPSSVEKKHKASTYSEFTSPAMSSNCMMGTKETRNATYMIGTYNLNGRSVSALRQVDTTTGVIMCNGRYAGHGKLTSDQVFTTRVLNGNRMVGCRESQVFSGYIFRLDNGQVVSAR